MVLVVGNIFRFETCMNSLVKVPPYSILNFQGKNFFTQNWCNITLNNNSPDIYLFILYMVFHVHIYMMVRKYYNDGHDWFDLIWSRNIYIYLYIFINWPLCMSNNLLERVQILCHGHFIFITVLEHRIICCQIFFDLLLKSAFERIFNVI
jgi:hypothetical protein